MLKRHLLIFTIASCMSLCLTACGSQGGSNTAPPNITSNNSSSLPANEDSNNSSNKKGSRDNTPHCLVPSADGTNIIGNETVDVDISHTKDGYICVTYKGDAERTRLIISTPLQVSYTYDLQKDVCDTFPLTGENGLYNVGIYELISGNDYSVLYNDSFEVTSIDEYMPYLYPNQYVKFDSSTKAISLASDLVYGANNDLDAITSVYDYVITNIVYDYDKAENVESTYVPDIDNILSIKKGICFDYASLMAAMLRSQGIPTRLEIGYAGDAYHAWISTYVKDVGWVNGIIEFNGSDWEIMDPTFAANMSEKKLKSFIGEGDNYITQYMY